ncbi:hypothetical protein ACJ73_02551 [Blastomyces percursus]|uniref:Uncharacterized protein n=1 Tax=Blastomyces percursus TaxID=1658174 RepID=A0A1J9REJ2_9EURO|nr:hypothetical protein ACJ73_02551 [Blastomyces percursus]
MWIVSGVLARRRLRRERSVDPSHETSQANKHHDALANLNQTSAAIDIDEDPETETDSALYMARYSSLKLKLERERQQKRETWVN